MFPLRRSLRNLFTKPKVLPEGEIAHGTVQAYPYPELPATRPGTSVDFLAVVALMFMLVLQVAVVL